MFGITTMGYVNTKFLMVKHVQKKKMGKDIGRKVTHFKDMHKTTLDRKNICRSQLQMTILKAI
jgi:hypothetical protein